MSLCVPRARTSPWVGFSIVHFSFAFTLRVVRLLPSYLPPPPHYFETERPEVLVDLCSGPFQTFSFLAQEQYFPVIAF